MDLNCLCNVSNLEFHVLPARLVNANSYTCNNRSLEIGSGDAQRVGAGRQQRGRIVAVRIALDAALDPPRPFVGDLNRDVRDDRASRIGNNAGQASRKSVLRKRAASASHKLNRMNVRAGR